MRSKRAKQLRKLVKGNQNAYFHAKKKYSENKSLKLEDCMRTKEEIEKEFLLVKNQMEQAEQVRQNCLSRLSELRGQLQILDQIEKAKAVKKTPLISKKEIEVGKETIKKVE